MLLDMIKNHASFQKMTYEQQQMTAILANTFEESPDNLFKSPDELAKDTSVGNRYTWASFLALEPVQQFIRAQIAQNLQIMQRKTLLALQREAQAGNVQAMKEIKELSGIMDRQDNNKVIVLHYVPRPKEVVSDGEEKEGRS